MIWNSYIQCTWRGCRSNSRTICCKSNSYRDRRCCRIQTNPSIPRLRSIWYTHTIWRTYTSRYRLHSSIHCFWYTQRFWCCWRSRCIQRSCRWYCNVLWFCCSQIYSRFRRGNSPLRYKRRLCTYSSQSSLRILRRRQRSRHIWNSYNRWYWWNKKDISLPRLRSIRNYHTIQYSSRTSICRLHTFDWYWCCSPLSDKWNWSGGLQQGTISRIRQPQESWNKESIIH